MTRPTVGRVLVTGATGFLGSALVDAITREGQYEVRVLCRSASRFVPPDGQSIECVHGDIRDPDAVAKAMAGCRRVFHVAAVTGAEGSGAATMHAVNVVGAENVARAALRAGVERLVHTSSIATVGVAPGDRVAGEDTMPGPNHPRTRYWQTKILGERRVLSLVAHGLPVVVVNPGYVFGPGPPGGLNRLFTWARRGWLRFAFDGGLSAVHVDDVARGHLLAMEHGKLGRRYILSAYNSSYSSFFESINEAVGRRQRLWRLPFAAMLVAGRAADGARWLTPWDPPWSADSARASRLQHYVSWERARRELGYSPMTLPNALERAVTWMRRETPPS